MKTYRSERAGMVTVPGWNTEWDAGRTDGQGVAVQQKAERRDGYAVDRARAAAKRAALG